MFQVLNRWSRKNTISTDNRKLSIEAKTLGLPDLVWGTKGFEFWSLLSLLLIRAKCKRILELGSSRSTLTFAEYAKFAGAEFISIETSAKWLKRTQFELYFANLPSDSVKYVQMDANSGWYNIDKFRALVSGHFDCILIDAPNNDRGESLGMRDSEKGITELQKLCQESDLIIVDDVHRRHIFDSLEAILSTPDNYDTYFYDYQIQVKFLNTLSISVKKFSNVEKSIPEILNFLKLDLSRNRQREFCPEF